MRNRRSSSNRSIFFMAGWLFADLLLAMMMIFLVASGVSASVPQTTHPSTPTQPALSPNPIEVIVKASYDGLFNADQNTISQVKAQVKSQLSKYQERKAAVVLTLAGGPNSQVDTSASTKVNAILMELGKDHFIFDTIPPNLFFDYINLSGPEGTITIDIYLFA